MAKHELDFTKERETKNTIRYQEDAKPGQPQVIGTLVYPEMGGATRQAQSSNRVVRDFEGRIHYPTYRRFVLYQLKGASDEETYG